MSLAINSHTLIQRVKFIFLGFDFWLLLAIAILGSLGLITMYSAGHDTGTRFTDHARNMILAAVLLFISAQIRPQRLMQLAVPLYIVGILFLIATLLPSIGITKKGATRWLNIGVVIQPSEILKTAMPLMLAWWFQRREGQLKSLDFVIAFILLAIPVALIIKQPDLGTALLVLFSGLYVIFFAGFSWRILIPVITIAAIGITAIIWNEERICQPDVEWPLLRTYQKHRICTLLDPMQDPLGKGFHIIQGKIAIGSGGIFGKGFMQGTQTHLEFIPEHTTDFIFASLSEEFGLVGCVILILSFSFLIFRSLAIANKAPTLFSRLLAGSIALSFFTYAFVNMGMVSGILPVVGVPLPFISYGGTAMVTLGLALGMLMSIAKNSRFMQA